VSDLSRRQHAPARVTKDVTAKSEFGLLEWIPDAIVISDSEGRIVFANRHTEEMTGYKQRELLGSPVELLVPEPQRAMHRNHRRDYYAGRAGPRPMGLADRDFKVLRKDGSEMFADIALGTINTPAGRHVISVIRDFTERRRLESALEHQALHDPLTGLANRTLFFDRLNQALSTARREQRRVALVMLDLDGFKDVNDAHGHAVGDQVLKKLAGRLQQELRATDTSARIGGDEFALILPKIAGNKAAERMVRQRMADLQGVYMIGKRRIVIGASAGVAMYPHDGSDTDTLLRHADSAMYFAKREGRGVAFYPSSGSGRG
jgi:diguanylate cyclase (GGDEF)-like protein/PAS domain S-box-containing protein